MGTFLAILSVIGKTKDEVVTSLAGYAQSVSGSLQQNANLDPDDKDCCVVEEARGNVSICYPYGFLEWDDSAAYISKDLNTAVFSFHIHDGDFWMYVLYHEGRVVDQFNPIPDYWDEGLAEEEMHSWKGNATTIARYVRHISPNEIDKYLVWWDMEADEPQKTYQTDMYAQDDWQLTDFMKKLGLPFPIDDSGKPKGVTFQLLTKQHTLPSVAPAASNATTTQPDKPWWKFW